MADEYRICLRPMKKRKARPGERPVPITCHHFVMAELLQYIIRPLAEIIESYRLALDDDIILRQFDTMEAIHRCDVTEIQCAFMDLDVYVTYNRARGTYYAWISYQTKHAEYYQFADETFVKRYVELRYPDNRNAAFKAIVQYVLEGRLPCDILQDCMIRVLEGRMDSKPHLSIRADLSIVEVKQDQSRKSV